MKNIQQGANEILQFVGGKENLSSATHCMTRLRLVLKDESIVDEEKLEKVEGVIKVVHAGGQVQIVIGQQVSKVYDEFCKIANLDKIESISDLEDDQNKPKEKLTIKKIINNIMSTLSGCIIPILPVFIAAGIFKMFSVLLGPEHLAVVGAESDLMKVFNMVGNAGYYFLPFYTAYSASKKFKVSPIMALLLVGVMMSPDMMAIIEAGEKFTVFGIPVHLVNYSQAVIPIILIVWTMSYVERFLNKIMPDQLRTIGMPVLTITIMLPIGLCVFGPLCYVVMQGVAQVILWLTETFGLLGIIVVSALWVFVVMFGMHVPILTALLPAQMQLGYDAIVYPAFLVSTFALMATFLAYALRARDKEKRSLGWACFITQTTANISEPGLYGIILNDRKALIFSRIGSICGGITCYLLSAKVYIFSGVGFPFLNPLRFGQDIVEGTIASIVAFVVTFAICIIFGFDGADKISLKEKLHLKK